MKSLVQIINEKLQISRNKNIYDNIWQKVLKHKYWKLNRKFWPESSIGRQITVTSQDVSPNLQNGRAIWFLVRSRFGYSSIETEIEGNNRKLAYFYFKTQEDFEKWFGKDTLKDMYLALNDLV